jgi:hypothetical protein
MEHEMPQFYIEQIAIAPRDPAAAKKLLQDMGFGEWTEDHVVASGNVYGLPGRNEANLSFNYEVMPEDGEFEVLDYTTGPNWVDTSTPRNVVSHLGMHCTAAELQEWRDFFAARGIRVAQEVVTESHTNPFLVSNGRKYNYVIFDTRDILGVDCKFIVRIDKGA